MSEWFMKNVHYQVIICKLTIMVNEKEGDHKTVVCRGGGGAVVPGADQMGGERQN